MSLISLFPLEWKYLKEPFLNISLPGTSRNSRKSKNIFLSGIWQVCAQCRVAREEGGQRREKHSVMKIGCQESLIWTPPLSDILITWIMDSIEWYLSDVDTSFEWFWGDFTKKGNIECTIFHVIMLEVSMHEAPTHFSNKHTCINLLLSYINTCTNLKQRLLNERENLKRCPRPCKCLSLPPPCDMYISQRTCETILAKMYSV